MRILALIGLSAFLGGCSGGGSSTSTLKSPCSSSASKFCLSSCNLGCSSVGCSITEIAQNQAITLSFSLAIDPASVNGSSVSLKTAAGEPPSGSISVQGQSLTFVPEVRIVGGATQFGFRANETYILTLPGGLVEQQSLRSIAGQVLAETVSCTLRVTRGIVDPDGQEPKVKLVTPDAQAQLGAPRDTQIVLEFSEYIDVSPFIGATSATSPVQYRIRKTRRDANNNLICDPAQIAVVLEGVPRTSLDTATQTTQVILKPSIRLPSQVCVEVEVTNRVKDLSGKSVKPTLFTFFTEAAASEVLTLDETFSTEAQLDKDQSGGSWSNGGGVFGQVGGDGLHGDFDVTDGQFNAPNIYVWSTDSQALKKPTLTGVTPPLSPVTDGVFRFSNFKLAKGTVVDFRGSRPPRILVRGSVEIAGTIRVNGIPITQVTSSNATGQLGSAGGPGGGKGGQGGDRGDGVSNGGGNYNGRNGEDLKLPAGHAYGSRVVGTGGKGSLQFPASGKNSDVTFKAQGNAACGMIVAGGAGGGNFVAGSPGRATNSPSTPKELSPDSVGGAAFDPFPVPPGTKTFDHFLYGGAGGGGGGSHPFYSFSSTPPPKWNAGAGGTGGGGAVGIRIGRDLTLTGDGRIESRGGDGLTYTVATQSLGPPAPGGAGAGGSIVLQVGGSILQSGVLDTSGGRKSQWDLTVLGANTEGGDGAPGYVRLEMLTAPSPALLGNTIPTAGAKNVGKLEETDSSSGFQSKWYSTRLLFSPTFLYYTAEAQAGATKLTFSDDPARGVFAGYGQNQAITVLVQGGKVNQTTGLPDSGSVGPWRAYVGPFNNGENLNKDNVTGFRFMVLVNRALAPDLVMKRFTVAFRE